MVGVECPNKLLEPHDGNAGLCAVDAERMPQVVDPHIVQPSFAAGTLEDALGQLIRAEWVGKDRVRWSARVRCPIFCPDTSQRQGNGHHARAG